MQHHALLDINLSGFLTSLLNSLICDEYTSSIALVMMDDYLSKLFIYIEIIKYDIDIALNDINAMHYLLLSYFCDFFVLLGNCPKSEMRQ